MENKSLNLALLADRLYNGKWMLSATSHDQLCKQFEKMLVNEIDASQFVPEAEEYVPNADNPIDTTGAAVTGIINIRGILAKSPSLIEQHFLGLVDVDDIGYMLDQAACDPEVKEIVLKFASPGGETTGIEELGRKIEAINANIKPVYAFTEQMCCSAAYWLAVNCERIGMTRSAKVGSVGVYCLILDETEAMKNAGVEIVPFVAGKYKVMGHSWHVLSKEEKSILMADVERQGTKFRSIVSAKRKNITMEDMEGLSYEGDEALANGYADILADSLDDFIDNEINSESNTNNMKIEKKIKVEAKAPETITEAKAETKAEETPTTTFNLDVDTTTAMEKVEQLSKKVEELIKKFADIPGLPGVTTAEDMDEEDDDEDKDYDDDECTTMEAKTETAEVTAEQFRSWMGIQPVAKKSQDVLDFHSMTQKAVAAATERHDVVKTVSKEANAFQKVCEEAKNAANKH